MRNDVRLAIALGLFLFAAHGAATAQSGASEATGTVTDDQGNPIADALVKFVPQGNPTLVYSGKTSKKGKYWVTGLWTPKENDMWDMSIEAEGFLPVKVHIETRTVNRVLVGDAMDVKLRANQKAPSIPIKPLGSAQVDWTMHPAADVLADAQAPVATPPGEGVAPEAGAEPKPVEKDPWVEAVTLANAGDRAGALPFFVKAIEAKPDDAERHEAYAKVLYQLARHAEAEAPAKRAVELAPTRLEAHMVLYAIVAGQEQWEHAIEVLDQAAQVAPDDLRILEQRAYVATKRNRSGDAIAAYEKMASLAPDKPDAWLALGGLYAADGDMKKSEAAYSRVVQLDPGSAYQTFYNLGVLITNREERSEDDTHRALDAFKKAVEIKPDYAAAHKQIGLLLIETGDRPAAASALELYIQHDPKAKDKAQMQALIAAMKKK